MRHPFVPVLILKYRETCRTEETIHCVVLTYTSIDNSSDMENDLLDSLEEIGYTGSLLDEKSLQRALEGGAKNTEYTQLVEWICKELKSLCNLEETVNAVSTENEASNFLLEISSFLKELGCSYTTLVEGHLSERLNSKENRLLLLDYLIAELMAARMIRVNKPHLHKGIELKLKESSTAADLKSLLIALRFPKPPDNIPPDVLFSKVEQKLKDVLKQAPPQLVGKPLFNGKLSDKQWHTLAETQKELQQEYFVRRDMLIKRLDVTVQSFQWSERAKTNENEIISKFHSQRSKMVTEPKVDLADLLAAREDLAILEKTSSASVRKNTKSEINRVLIGMVPDRGGRPNEQEAPPPEMPSWQKERSQGGGGSGRGGDFSRGGGNRGGGRVQGNWNPGNQRQDNRGGYDNRGGHQDSRSSYQDNRGGYQPDTRGGYQDNKGYYDNRDRDRGGYKDRNQGGGGGYRDRRDNRRDYR